MNGGDRDGEREREREIEMEGEDEINERNRGGWRGKVDGGN